MISYKSKLGIAGAVLIVAWGLWNVRHQSLLHAQQQLEQAKARFEVVTNNIAEAEADIQTTREQSRAAAKLADATWKDVADLTVAITKNRPEARWVVPPAELPAWVEESPYIWLRKDRLDVLPVQPFEQSGMLRGEVLIVLATDDRQDAALAAKLPPLLSEYRKFEAGSAVYVKEPLAGIYDGEIKTVSIAPQSKDGARLKERFVFALREILGEQRAGLISKMSGDWIHRQFGQTGQAKVISLVRHPNGSFNVAVKDGGSWMSCGIWKNAPPTLFANYIPKHILPMFTAILPPQALNDSEESP